MTFVPHSALESLSGLAAAAGISMRVELFSCRKAAAQYKKRERQQTAAAAAEAGAEGGTAAAAARSPTSADTSTSAGLLEAGGMLEAFARTSSFSDDAALPMYVPALVATMNGLYADDGFDFTGVLTDEHFVHFSDPIAFEMSVADAFEASGGANSFDWVRAWKIIADAALSKDPSSDGAHPGTPMQGPMVKVGDWAELFRIRDDCPLLPNSSSDDDASAGPAHHFFAYCRKTRNMVSIIIERQAPREGNSSANA